MAVKSYYMIKTLVYVVIFGQHLTVWVIYGSLMHTLSPHCTRAIEILSRSAVVVHFSFHVVSRVLGKIHLYNASNPQ